MNYYGVTMNDDYLAHHGVKGQKWGVRHDPNKGLSHKQKRILRKVGYVRSTKISRPYGSFRWTDNVKRYTVYDENNPWGAMSFGYTKKEAKDNLKKIRDKNIKRDIFKSLRDASDGWSPNYRFKLSVKDISNYYKKNPKNRQLIDHYISKIAKTPRRYNHKESKKKAKNIGRTFVDSLFRRR